MKKFFGILLILFGLAVCGLFSSVAIGLLWG